VSEQPETPTVPSTAGSRIVAGKGRPTPKRSEAQKRRSGPVPPPPATRKEAAQRLRASQAEQRKQVREGTAAGDDSRMLRRDAGPVRALVRDVVDRRRNVAVLLLPAALLLLIAQLVAEPAVLSIAVSLWSATLLAAFLDLMVTLVLLRRAISAAFPDEKLRGHLFYGLIRTTVFRRFRMPPPRVRPGGLFGR